MQPRKMEKPKLKGSLPDSELTGEPLYTIPKGDYKHPSIYGESLLLHHCYGLSHLLLLFILHNINPGVGGVHGVYTP